MSVWPHNIYRGAFDMELFGVASIVFTCNHTSIDIISCGANSIAVVFIFC